VSEKVGCGEKDVEDGLKDGEGVEVNNLSAMRKRVREGMGTAVNKSKRKETIKSNLFILVDFIVDG
jgi:hypothetical protein